MLFPSRANSTPIRPQPSAADPQLFSFAVQLDLDEPCRFRAVDLHGVDLSAALRSAVPPPPAPRARDPLGRPPASEPRRTTERLTGPQRALPTPRAATRPAAPAPAPAPVAAPPPAPSVAPAHTGADVPAGQLIPHESVRVARQALAEARAQNARQAAFDAALADLVRLRLQVERVTVVVAGEERVLFDGPATPKARDVA